MRYTAGTLFRIDRRASVQFGNPFYFRLIRAMNWPTYHGWIWLDGYELNDFHDAVERRTIFVQVIGLRVIPPKKR